jgi:predicted MFS family arabinose efflux permease
MLGVGLALGQYLSALIGSLSPIAFKFTYLLLGCLAAGLGALTYLARFRLTPVESEQAPGQRLQRDLRPTTWLLLAQYLPGAVPWGALTVFIFPYLESKGVAKHSAVLLVTILGVGMIAGAYIAGRLGDALKRRGPNTVLIIVIAFFFAGLVYTMFLIRVSEKYPAATLAILYFLGGVLLSIPGAYIKGMLFDSADGRNVRTVFSLENFLESVGKGIGPFIVGLLISAFGEIERALYAACLFWLLCLIPLAILIFLNRRPGLNAISQRSESS